MKFDSYDWNNINETRFFGRTFNDVLLDVFYYQLERRLSNTTSTDSSGKHWLRLLLGDQRDPRECLLRYFARFSGVFTTLHQCGVRGGHPVCQREPSRMNLSIVTTTAALPLCDNCTTDLVADEDLLNNETNIEYRDSNSTTTKNDTRHRLLLMLVSGPLFACSILAVGIGFLVRYVRTVRGSYSPQRQSLVPSRRRRCTVPSSPPASDTSSTAPAVLYTRLRSTSSVKNDGDILDESSTVNDDDIQLLPQPNKDLQLQQTMIPEDEDESFYATVRDTNEK